MEVELEQLLNELGNRHVRCLCHLEVFIHYLTKIYHGNTEWQSNLALAYLTEMHKTSAEFPDCRPKNIDDIEEDFDFFGWHSLQRFCRNRKHAPILRLMLHCAETIQTGHYPSMFKIADVDDCVREAVIYHDAYDALEKQNKAAALFFLWCLQQRFPDVYCVKDMRRQLYNLIADCSDNDLHRNPKLGLLFKPPNPDW